MCTHINTKLDKRVKNAYIQFLENMFSGISNQRIFQKYDNNQTKVSYEHHTYEMKVAYLFP